MEQRRILIVDDEPKILNLLRELLVTRGYVVDSAATAAQALELIRRQIYDAAVLDFNLPDMDGVMLHHEIRGMDAELAARTLFISGLAQSDKNLGYYEAFGGGFVSKPFDVARFVGALQGLWESGD